MATSDTDETRDTDEKGYRHVNFFRAMLIKAMGPAELGENGPLTGTKYDPALKKEKAQRKWRQRRAKVASQGGERQRAAHQEPEHHH
ncbi:MULTISPECIES: hypothetical protein [Pseudofrankia]|uniref:hypothetical protein n=1 Tax=Pseudofrankia TaxID=2994363 RepID=UPI000234CD98|nr:MULTISPECIES: hypothetical protein [Pseudofrankia]OHV31557.1 hypothetical protein BCD49_31515 [Pseudofrankia sp. EUN1h]